MDKNIFELYDHKDLPSKGDFLSAWADYMGKQPSTLKTWFHFKRLAKSVTEGDKKWAINWMQNAIKLNQ